MISQLFTAGPFWSNPLLESTVCITVGLIASWFLRRRSARAHQVLFLAMIASVAVPAMSMIVRHYELGIFADKPAVTKSQLAEIPIVPIITEYEISPLPAIPNAYYPPAIETEYAMPASAVSSEAKAKLPLSTILIWSWIIVSTILAARLFVTFILGLRMLRRAFPLHCDKLEKALLIAKGKLGIDKSVVVLAGSTVSSPVIWCWSRRPALLVPADAEQFEDGVDWVGMFCHELAHWSRLDHITGLFAELIVCVFPWHPLMWWAKRRLAGLSEQACDDWVVAGSRSPADYAESLLDFSPQGQLSFLPAVVGRKNGLENRVRRIIKDKCGNPRLGLCWAVVVTLITACVTLGAAFAQTRPADTGQTKECEELTTREKQQLLLEQKQLELLTAQKEFEQLAEELKVQQIQRDQLLQYQMNLQNQVDDLTRELEALKNYQAEKAKLHDHKSATIKETNKVRQKFGTTVPEEPVHSDSRLQDSERDKLILSKNELKKLKDRTRQQLDGLPKEADKLRDKLKEIEAMIRTIDSRLPSVRHQQKIIDDSRTEQEMAQRQEMVAERRSFIAEHQALQLLAQEIEGRLKAAPDRKDAEELKERLEKYRKRIQTIDSTLSSPEWCPEKRKAEQLKKPQIPTDVGNLIDKQKPETSCSSCHADIDHIEVHRKSRDADYAIAELINRQSQWCAEMRAFEADVVAAKQRIIDAKTKIENDQAMLKQINQEIKIFTSENGANFGTDISLFNKLKTMEANRDRLAEKIERDKRKLAKYQEELKAAVERRNIYLKYKPPTSTEDEDIQRFIKEKEGLERMYDPWHIKPPVLPQERDFRRQQQGFQTTTPPSQQGQAYSPWQPQEKLQSRINQLQDEISRLRSEMTELRKLMKDLVEHEKKLPKLSPLNIDKDPMNIKENRHVKPLPEIHDYPLGPETIEPIPNENKRPKKSLDDIPIGPDEIETTEPIPLDD